MISGWVGSRLTVVEPRVGAGATKICVKVFPVWRYRPRLMRGWSVDGLDDAPLVTELTPRMPLAIGTSKLPFLSKAICPIARWKKMSLPATNVQLLPPSVDL